MTQNKLKLFKYALQWNIQNDLYITKTFNSKNLYTNRLG